MSLTLYGRILITGAIRLKTGLHIGGASGALAIGNLDLPVIRDALSNRPYIPGSSLKGKMRSLSEKLTGAPSNRNLNKGKPDGSGSVNIHVAETREQYDAYWVNPIFGVMGDSGSWMTAPNRLIVRDVPLSEESAKRLEEAKTDLPYTEVKWEAAIDRVTSAATPRQIERVPAGAVFSKMELVFSVYEQQDLDLFSKVLIALQLVEDDYIGGQGSRGSGKVAFESLTVTVKAGSAYAADQRSYAGLGALQEDAGLAGWLAGQFRFGA